jgi:hypothetical protein
MLNLLVFLGAFILQWGVGAIIAMWPTTVSGYDPDSYQAAIAVLVLLQVAGLIWYLISLKISRKQSVLL